MNTDPTNDLDEIEITDFRMAGFLVANNVEFTGSKINNRGELVFFFSNRPINGKTADHVINQYPGSKEQRYDAACKAMHDLVKLRVIGSKKRG